MTGGTCAVCQATAGQQCAGCKVVFYCGREHQRSHWPQHRAECRPISLISDSKLGRHLIAARDIAAGELILRESPAVLEKLYTVEDGSNEGPKWASKPVCLGCHKPANVSCPCSGCGWPLCSSQCETSQQHRAECALMKSRGYHAKITDSNRQLSEYVCISPLRVLLMPEDKRKNILQLQSHLETKKKTPLYNVLKNNVVKFLREVLGLEQFSEDDILQICAIFDTNAFEVKPFNGIRVRGLFLLASMMAHDCRPNTRHVFDDKNCLLLYSTVDIKQGENVTATYTNTFWGTTLRRAHLRSAKCFECECSRCKDPTEFGTFVGAILCSRCSKGHVISTTPLQDVATWRCNECSHEMTAKQIEWGNQALKQEIDALDKSGPASLEQFLEKYKNVLHPTNGHALQVKHALSQLYGNAHGFLLAELNEAQLERKLEISHELLDVVKILEPGQSRMRALLLFDIQAAMAMQVKIDYDADRITKERAQELLCDAMGMLEEATQILRTEPGMEVILQERLSALASQLDIELETTPVPKTMPKSRLSKPPATASEDS